MTIDQMINPNVRSVGTPQMAKELDRAWNAYYSKKCKSLFTRNGTIVYFYTKVPSARSPDSPLIDNARSIKPYINPVFYDVLIEFHPTKNKTEAMGTVLGNVDTFDVKAYTNNPAFHFIFMHIYNKLNSICDLALEKGWINKYALKHKPRITNPYGIPGIDKRIYYCVKDMRAMRFLQMTPDDITNKGYPPTKFFNEIIPSIMSTDEKAAHLKIEQELLQELKGKRITSASELENKTRNKRKSVLGLKNSQNILARSLRIGEGSKRANVKYPLMFKKLDMNAKLKKSFKVSSMKK